MQCYHELSVRYFLYKRVSSHTEGGLVDDFVLSYLRGNPSMQCFHEFSVRYFLYKSVSSHTEGDLVVDLVFILPARKPVYAVLSRNVRSLFSV